MVIVIYLFYYLNNRPGAVSHSLNQIMLNYRVNLNNSVLQRAFGETFFSRYVDVDTKHEIGGYFMFLT